MFSLTLLLCSVTFVLSQDSCVDFNTCIANAKATFDAKMKTKMDEMKTKFAEMKTKEDACFRSNDCDVPPPINFTRGGNVPAEIQAKIANIESCKASAKAKIESCVSTKVGITFTFPTHEEGKHGFHGQQHGGWSGKIHGGSSSKNHEGWSGKGKDGWSGKGKEGWSGKAWSGKGHDGGHGKPQGSRFLRYCKTNESAAAAVETCMNALLPHKPDVVQPAETVEVTTPGVAPENPFEICVKGMSPECKTQKEAIKTALCDCSKDNETKINFETCANISTHARSNQGPGAHAHFRPARHAEFNQGFVHRNMALENFFCESNMIQGFGRQGDNDNKHSGDHLSFQQSGVRPGGSHHERPAGPQ